MELMSLKNMGFDPNLLETLHDLLDFSDEQNQQSHLTPPRQYVREAKAMAATPADVKETPNAYVFVVDLAGLSTDQIQVKIEDENVLVVCGERKREKERDQGIRYLRMERRLGKYLKKFVLPENADTEKISAEYQNGVLTVTVEKRPPPEPKKPKTIQVQIRSNQGGGEGGGQGGYGGHGKQSGEGGGQDEQGGGQQGGYQGQGGGQGGRQGGHGGQSGGQGAGQGGGQGGQTGGGQGGYGGQGDGRGGQGIRIGHGSDGSA